MISKELLSLVLDEDFGIIEKLNDVKIVIFVDEDQNKLYIKTDNSKYVQKEEIEQTEYKEINLDTLCRLCKEWMVKDNNDIINTFNSSSVNGWVCTSSAYNKRFVEETELKAVIKMCEYIVNDKKNSVQ